jgi:Tfp pilus assembly protein PilE
MRRHQSGMTLISFLITAAVVGFFLFIVMKLFPMYREYFEVKSALKGLANEAGIAHEQPAQIKEKFFKRLYINYSENVKNEHVKIENKGGGQTIYVNYEVRVPLFYNLDAVGKFTAEQPLSGGAASAPL